MSRASAFLRIFIFSSLILQVLLDRSTPQILKRCGHDLGDRVSRVCSDCCGGKHNSLATNQRRKREAVDWKNPDEDSQENVTGPKLEEILRAKRRAVTSIVQECCVGTCSDFHIAVYYCDYGEEGPWSFGTNWSISI